MAPRLLLFYLLVVTICHLQASGEEVSTCRKVNDSNQDDSKIICVCNANFCHYLEFDWPKQQNQVVVVESSKAGKRFRVTNLTYSDHDQTFAGEVTVQVNLSDTHQTILGWGGSFTDSFGYNLVQLDQTEASLSNQLIKSYFGQNGLQYNYARVPIGGADFSLRPYSYDDTEKDLPDYELKNWTLQEEDYRYKIGPIKTALNLMANVTSTDKLKLIGSPWSPPKWMKTNKNFVQGFLIDDDKIYKSYANYQVKFYESYAKEGIKFWGGTIQNEPLLSYASVYTFNSLQFGNKQMIKFISKYLGPALQAHNLTKENFKLMVGDDSLGLVNAQVPLLLENEEVQQYVSGVGFHWYLSNNFVVPHETLGYLHEMIANKSEFTLMTEACEGWKQNDKKVDLGSWERGESYAYDIIKDLEHNTNGWIDWNMALDTEGGPNWAKNYVDSPIIVNASAGEFYKQPMYYTLAHFSRFFRPGSIRVGSKYSGHDSYSEKLLTSAVYNNQSGHLSITLLNKSTDRIKVNLIIQGNTGASTLSPVIDSKSVTSLVIKI